MTQGAKSNTVNSSILAVYCIILYFDVLAKYFTHPNASSLV